MIEIFDLLPRKEINIEKSENSKESELKKKDIKKVSTKEKGSYLWGFLK